MNSPFVIIEKFDDYYTTDDERAENKGDRLIDIYQKADEKGKALIDDIFTTLCGYSFKTIADIKE